MNRNKSMRNSTISSMIWKFLERIVAQAISLIVSIIIARIIDPSAYGVVSLVTIFFVFSDVIIAGGLNTALIQKKECDELDYSSVFWASLIFSIIIYLLLFAFAPLISNLYNQPILISIIRVMGLVLPVYAAKSIVCAYISATLQFKKFFFATIGGTVLSGMIGIFLATKGYGAWALVAQQVINTAVDTLLLYLTTKLKIHFKMSLIKIKKLFGYGWKILVSSLINTLYNEIRPLFIGAKYSAADLSYYSKGNSFPSLISTTTTNTLSAVLFPVLARFQDDKEALLKYTRLFIKIASFLVFPLMLGLFATSDNLISVLLTDKWIEASYYVKIFSLSSMFNMINIGNCETIKAMGRSDIYLIIEIIKKTAYFFIIGSYLVFRKSARDLAAASIFCTVVAVAVNTFPNRKLIDYKYSDQLFDIFPNLITAIIMCMFVWFIGKINIDKTVLLITQIIIGGFIYLVLNLIIKNESMNYLVSYIKDLCFKNTK